MNAAFPRVLVVTPQPFNYITGLGITISNLFAAWPAEKLACLYYEGITPETGVCKKVFRLTDVDGRLIFPLNLFPIFHRENKHAGSSTSVAEVSSKFSSAGVLKKSLKRLSAAMGIGETLCLGNIYRYRLREHLRKWLNEFNPEVLYCSVASLSDVILVIELSKVTNTAIVVHIMDDWVEYQKNIPGLVPRLWAREAGRQLRRLIEKANVRMGIGAAMCREFEHRYGCEFIPFQNCPESSLWVKNGRKTWDVAGVFRFVFSGAVYNTCNSMSLIRLAQAISYLNITCRLSCVLEIHTNLAHSSKIIEAVRGCHGIEFKEVASEQGAVAGLYGSADALLLPFDFIEQARRLSQYSMPTKLPAYMLSASPMFVYGPDSIAAIKYVTDNGCGYVVNEECSINRLADHLEKFCADAVLRRSIALRAQDQAISSFSAEVVRPLFADQICRAMQGV